MIHDQYATSHTPQIFIINTTSRTPVNAMSTGGEPPLCQLCTETSVATVADMCNVLLSASADVRAKTKGKVGDAIDLFLQL
jgi:hypothetical protein